MSPQHTPITPSPHPYNTNVSPSLLGGGSENSCNPTGQLSLLQLKNRYSGQCVPTVALVKITKQPESKSASVGVLLNSAVELIPRTFVNDACFPAICSQHDLNNQLRTGNRKRDGFHSLESSCLTAGSSFFGIKVKGSACGGGSFWEAEYCETPCYAAKRPCSTFLTSADGLIRKAVAKYRFQLAQKIAS